MYKIRLWTVTTINMAIILIKTMPAWLIWILTGFAIKLDFRESNWNPIVEFPGWSRHELTWYIHRRFLLSMTPEEIDRL